MEPLSYHLTRQLEEKPDLDWEKKDERKARFKVDLILVPLLTFGYFCIQLTRNNVSNAITTSLGEDIGLSQGAYNLGSILFSLGSLVFEIPSNMIMTYVGPRIWLSSLIVLWGLTSMLQMFMTNANTFLALRFLVGFFQSGYVPGCFYVISQWYCRDEYAKRYVYFYVGNGLAGALGGVLASGIFLLDGTAGLYDWQWLFFIEGLMTMTIGVAYFCFLPESTANPRPLFFPNWEMLSKRECHIIHDAVILDDPTKGLKKVRIRGKQVVECLAQWRVWQHFMITLLGMTPYQGLLKYAPSIIKSAGYSVTTANSLASVGPAAGTVLEIILGCVSDKWKLRGFTVYLPVFVTLVSIAGILATTGSGSVPWVMVDQTVGGLVLALGISWGSVNLITCQDRAIGMALISMAANLSGISGALLFRENDAPEYNVAFLASFVLVLAAFILCLLTSFGYFRTNKWKNKHLGIFSRDEIEWSIEDMKTHFRYSP